jgi:hypothetical protein
MSGMPLFDTNPDALTASKIHATGTERRIYDILVGAHGHRHAIPIRTIHSVTSLSERVIKDAVYELIVTHRVRIGAVRAGIGHGYFMVESAEDAEIAIQPYKAQILTMLRRLKVLNGKVQVREWLGQMAVEFDETL